LVLIVPGDRLETCSRCLAQAVGEFDLRQLRPAMELSRELMNQGSHQVEMSDEGLMTDDVEECLQVIVKALQKSDLLPAEIVAWCKAMTKRDRVGLIYDRDLEALRKHAEASAT
jgi:hypothetical protein